MTNFSRFSKERCYILILNCSVWGICEVCKECCSVHIWKCILNLPFLKLLHFGYNIYNLLYISQPYRITLLCFRLSIKSVIYGNICAIPYSCFWNTIQSWMISFRKSSWPDKRYGFQYLLLYFKTSLCYVRCVIFLSFASVWDYLCLAIRSIELVQYLLKTKYATTNYNTV